MNIRSSSSSSLCGRHSVYSLSCPFGPISCLSFYTERCICRPSHRGPARQLTAPNILVTPRGGELDVCVGAYPPTQSRPSDPYHPNAFYAPEPRPPKTRLLATPKSCAHPFPRPTTWTLRSNRESTPCACLAFPRAAFSFPRPLFAPLPPLLNLKPRN